MAGILVCGAAMAAYAGIAAGPHSAAPVIAPQALTVVVSNQAAVPDDDLERALSVATRIFRSAALDVEWITLEEFAGLAPAETDAFAAYAASVVHVRFVEEAAPPVDARRHLLGSVPSGSSVAYVFADRVAAQVLHRQTPAGMLLGHVIAHEVGHVLLGPGAHARSGIMRARLHHTDVTSGHLSFDPAQAVAIRRSTAARQARHVRYAQGDPQIALLRGSDVAGLRSGC